MDYNNILGQLNSVIVALNTIEVKGEHNLASLAGSIKVIKDLFSCIQNEITNQKNDNNKKVGGD